MKYFSILCILGLLLSSCFTNNKPKLVHEGPEISETTQIQKDSTSIKIADLPIRMDSTSYLLHPIGDFQVKDKGGKILYSSSSYGGTSFSVSHYGLYSISGSLSNIMFQSLNSEKLKPLTDKSINIERVSFLQEIYRQSKKGVLLYELNDKDSNQDSKLDNNDIKSLYLSSIDGTSFKKLNTNDHEVLDWKVIPDIKRLYFRSIEDINKDGYFDDKDKVHYRFVDLNTNEFEVINYYPI